MRKVGDMSSGRNSSRTPKTMREIEIAVIRGALRRHNGSKQKAAKELGMGRTTMHRKCKSPALSNWRK